MQALQDLSLLHSAFALFNQMLFNGRLPEVALIEHRQKGAKGYFASNAAVKKDGSRIHEIAINPTNYDDTAGALSTLIHEMVHLQQEVEGKPGSRGYHNREWVRMMLAVGLEPVSIDKPGKGTGFKVTHTIMPGGKSEKAISFVTDELELRLVAFGGEAKKKKKKRNKTTYECGSCGLKVWGKPGLNVACVDCAELLEEA